MYDLLLPKSYRKYERRFLKKHPELLQRYQKTLELLQVNPHHPSLRLHALSGTLTGLYSVSISLQYRITLELEIKEKQILLVSVGSHNEVY
ncbi:MAG: type II toxin-antitoxin system mRNA interferase toxin, RelE/StbE family [SAR324 cluster bacterium]|nr:type II toxin-antitoxin system mRNA interferase toxin, RelE/StbE family [SAR324 cluster bacterium]MBL7034447.1 type II toxin-antitoxin system mRNA interferase toxin, RelE/StbE family [SAR324 cluster bacterium]